MVLTEEFAAALQILEGGGNLFLTGKAGTGKSTLIRHYLERTKRRVVVAAPTGIAALNVEGYTIHRLFSFQTTTSLDDVRSGTYRPGRFATTLRQLDTLIIDEASMVRADIFDMVVTALERFGPQPGERYGGVQLVLVGDLFQLPPVVTTGEEEYFSTRYETPYFFSADQFERADFPTVALTTVFRQRGDQRLTALLNAVREGVLIEESRRELNSRTNPDFVPGDDEFWLTLAPTNRVVDARNRRHLERLPGDVIEHRATERGDLGLFDPPVERMLQIKVGAQIMMVTNDGAGRWVNGTLGRIAGIENGEQGLQVAVEFRDGSAAMVGPYTWEATRPVVEAGGLRHEVVGSYTQLPFKLAWAITIHKSQGQTLDRLVVDLSGGAFDYGQVYVALSRCTSFDGLVLTRPVLPKDLKTDRRILRFLHSATASDAATGRCALAILTVGDEGRMSRPRPVEIAVAFEDGTALSTLVNPERDLADARTTYGISVDDVLMAPTLAEVWSVLLPLLDGHTPVGVETDRTLGLIDFELKRLGTVSSLPLGIDVPRERLNDDERRGLSAGTALARARAALSAYARLQPEDESASAFTAVDGAEAGASYLLTRDPDEPTPSSAVLPTLSALVETSRAVSDVLLRGAGAAEVRDRAVFLSDPEVGSALRGIVSDRLHAVVERASSLPPVLADRLRGLEQILGIDVVSTLLGDDDGSAIGAVLTPGTRVCFTGTACLPDGRTLSREEMTALAEERGLVPVNTVTKKKCDVLVVAEVGTQSGKARKAKEYGHPVFSVADFLAWVDGT
ncbi:AAA family ATPase [Georgenia wutianyii]|uniref:AAA family ATPase n=1 Tax=Georgenia wutianyii TaxID=2585135 RepID=A0ABX5VM93_9MICO|nr:AAA family ATPase [Georgenia wutianyii]